MPFQIVKWADGRYRVLEDRPESMVRVHGTYRTIERAEHRLKQLLLSQPSLTRFLMREPDAAPNRR